MGFSIGDIGKAATTWSTGGLNLLGDGGAGSIFGDITGANAANKAAKQQAEAAAQNTALQREMWLKSLELNKPFYDAGVNALGKLQSFQMPDTSLNSFQASPDYNFRLQQGQNALLSGASAAGMRLSGKTLKALQDYGQNTAAGEYTNWYGRRMGENQDQWNRTSQIAGFGTGATSNAIGANANAANAISQNNTNAANANSAATMQPYNFFTNMLGQGLKAYGAA